MHKKAVFSLRFLFTVLSAEEIFKVLKDKVASRLSFFMLGAVRQSGADRVQMEHQHMEKLDKMELLTPICGGNPSLQPIYIGLLNFAH